MNTYESLVLTRGNDAKDLRWDLYNFQYWSKLNDHIALILINVKLCIFPVKRDSVFFKYSIENNINEQAMKGR